MTEPEFLARWAREKPVYAAWGDSVRREVERGLGEQIGASAVAAFLRVPSSPRLKDDHSMIAKAFYRKKYSNPWEQVTDKIGVRFVVLTTKDLRELQSAIENSSMWYFSKDRDFERERADKPEVFAYQSDHYVVRARNAIETQSGIIEVGTPCEIQIRSLLQHAYSELTHDTLYKPSVQASPEAKRYAARSVALLESADEAFLRVAEEIAKAQQPMEGAVRTLTASYKKLVGLDPEQSKVGDAIVEAFFSRVPNDVASEMESLLARKPYIAARIKERAPSQLLFRHPAALLVYLLAEAAPNATRELWPLPSEALRPFYKDLGEALPVGD